MAVAVGAEGPDRAALPADVADAAAALLADTADPHRPGAVQDLPRPLAAPKRLLLAGVGAGAEADWRAAGAALARTGHAPFTVALPAAVEPAAVRGLVEGLQLASYAFVAERPPAKSGTVTLAVPDPDAYADVVATATATAAATALARDLTNTPSSRKNPAWFAREVERAAADRAGLDVKVLGPAELAAGGFGGLLAVGGGSATPPRLVELRYRPRRATTHVVLVGKGITFDTGGLSIKPADAMKLMRKDMGGAAAVVAATLGAAALRLPVRITTLTPLAENAVSGSAYRPGDVITHYDGRTSEITNTDAEGRLVLADALGYAVRKLRPDVLVDLATLTGANAIALGKRHAALYSDNDALATALADAAGAAGERTWRMPLAADYVEYLASDLADLLPAPERGAGSVVAALYLREFAGDLRDRWAHLDMSAPSWSDAAEGELAKGATGWGVRTLLRWLATL
ncbi:leucyl aminopeptidase family protein [Pilimelia anulata]|uniref:leucyl aminopeptidase family protein n=1 Tax=Pilimelia anulata TaxID=53371 RepID=UPI001E5640C1|nr:leucyl aminopeptidase family protein [Pilimelia anulata]